MKVLLELFKNVYAGLIKHFVDKETGEIATRALLVSAIILTIGAIYTAYVLAINSISLALPPVFDIGLMFIPDNTPYVLTAITSLRVALYISSLKLGLASAGVMK